MLKNQFYDVTCKNSQTGSFVGIAVGVVAVAFTLLISVFESII